MKHDPIANGIARIEQGAAKEATANVVPGGPNIAPHGDLVLIRRVSQEKTEAGVILPEVARDRMMSQVVESGPGRVTDFGAFVPTRFQPGQYVLISGHANAYPIDRDHVMVHDKDILGVWRQGPRDS